jgi:uncharacterized membrane protein YbaN (DUF454 family)
MTRGKIPTTPFLLVTLWNKRRSQNFPHGAFWQAAGKFNSVRDLERRELAPEHFAHRLR